MPILVAEDIIGVQNVGLAVAVKQIINRCVVSLCHDFHFINLILDYH